MLLTFKTVAEPVLRFSKGEIEWPALAPAIARVTVPATALSKAHTPCHSDERSDEESQVPALKDIKGPPHQPTPFALREIEGPARWSHLR